MNPVLVEATRGPRAESLHRGTAVAVDARGVVLASWGDIALPVYPRSAVKPLQALPVIESGAADAFALTRREIALACSSHSGESIHTAAVAAWLERLGLGPGDLECGAHRPMDEETATTLLLAGEAPTALHNNCSGKHAGMLTTARHLGETTLGYLAADHPIQTRVRKRIGEMADTDLGDAPCGIDGCGIPTLALPLAALATAFARLPGVAAGRRVLEAMAAEPYLVGGRDRFDSLVMAAAQGAVVCKGGAEGVWAAVLPQRGIGLALKIDDGAKRAAEAAMAALLGRFSPEVPADVLDRFAAAPILNVAGRWVGTVRAVLP
ncbi:MAG: asparaginase [Magnetospirillum sp. WYHS-4]